MYQGFNSWPLCPTFMYLVTVNKDHHFFIYYYIFIYKAEQLPHPKIIICDTYCTVSDIFNCKLSRPQSALGSRKMPLISNLHAAKVQSYASQLLASGHCLDIISSCLSKLKDPFIQDVNYVS